jgi:drug/metabolite transporter (DMT)-like permease
MRIYAAFLGCCLIWGSTFLAIRLGNEATAPVWGAAIRLVRAAVLQAPRQAAVPANAVGAAVGAVVCLVVSTALGEAHTFPATPGGWLPLLYLVVAGSLGAFVLFSWLIARWSVTNASLIGVIVPIIAVILGAIVKAEAPAPLTYVGAAIVITAVLVAIRAPHRAAEPAPARAA